MASFHVEASLMTKATKTPKRIRPSIKHDPIHPSDYLKYEIAMACEDCTHFKSDDATCTLGYHTIHHRRETQKQSYELTGKVAICRFMEID